MMVKNSSKHERLQRISKEVDDFHPLLNELFPRLTGIKRVYYTHGANEKGADFVLIKEDQTLGGEVIIGVVVKIGTIKQDNSSVREQIHECSLLRKIEGGKKEVTINEVWVVSNSTITSGAKDKINHDYRDKNVMFIDGELLVQLIDRHYSEYWTDISVELGNYFREVLDNTNYLIKSVDILDLSSHDDFEIDYKFRNLSEILHADPGRKKSPKIYSLEELIDREKLIFIQGSMGTGKSKIISLFTKRYSSNSSFNDTRTVPFPISFHNFVTDFNSDIQALKNIVDEKVKVKGINYLFMLDGLDELKESDLSKLERVRKIYESVSSDNSCKVIITSRPFEELGSQNSIEKYFSVYEILPLTIKQVVDIVKDVCKKEEVKDKLLKDLEKSHLFKVLPKTPISAIILAKLLKQDVQEIPSTMPELYSKYTELVLGRWDIDRGLQSQKEYDTCINVSANVAKFMLDNEIPQISISEFRDMFDQYVNARKLDLDSNDVFSKLISNAELYVFDTKRKTINFVHRTFTEYFYAYCMNRDKEAVLSEEIYTLYWSNVYFFYFGLNKDSEQLVTALSSIHLSNEEARLAHVFHNGNLLLAAYLTPYAFIKDSVLKSFSEASKFYTEVVNRKINTPLLALPQLHVLSIISYGMASSYGYDFFMDILEERSLELTTDPHLMDSEESIAELFLINSALIYNDRFNAYDKMLTDYGKKIPLIFQLGIQHYIEIKKSGTHSPAIKKYIKEFKKRFEKTIGVKQSVYKLIKEPLDKEYLKKPNLLA